MHRPCISNRMIRPSLANLGAMAINANQKIWTIRTSNFNPVAKYWSNWMISQSRVWNKIHIWNHHLESEQAQQNLPSPATLGISIPTCTIQHVYHSCKVVIPYMPYTYLYGSGNPILFLLPKVADFISSIFYCYLHRWDNKTMRVRHIFGVLLRCTDNNRIYLKEQHMGVSLNAGTPNLHPKMIIFSRKTHGSWVPPF